MMVTRDRLRSSSKGKSIPAPSECSTGELKSESRSKLLFLSRNNYGDTLYLEAILVSFRQGSHSADCLFLYHSHGSLLSGRKWDGSSSVQRFVGRNFDPSLSGTCGGRGVRRNGIRACSLTSDSLE